MARSWKIRKRLAVYLISQTEGALKPFAWLINLLAQGEMRLIVTGNGAIGRVPNEAMVGDRLALVAGVPVPLTLRTREPAGEDWHSSEYEVIGHAYIQGWMDGLIKTAILEGDVATSGTTPKFL
ncbi:hypothetical protein F4818DRAFT_443470 [Hypoxylon cercidicola]|nr:hypothetical protein F4818DRAFT_443470 [Hypoxylon cercidicola]